MARATCPPHQWAAQEFPPPLPLYGKIFPPSTTFTLFSLLMIWPWMSSSGPLEWRCTNLQTQTTTMEPLTGKLLQTNSTVDLPGIKSSVLNMYFFIWFCHNIINLIYGQNWFCFFSDKLCCNERNKNSAHRHLTVAFFKPSFPFFNLTVHIEKAFWMITFQHKLCSELHYSFLWLLSVEEKNVFSSS